ncbi:MAG: cyclic nucleotide-binding domain-containing protein, partial [Usitatibacteraceae bacterium]
MNAIQLQAPNPRQNQLLASLAYADRARWQPRLELVDLPQGMVLCESGGVPTHAYFPTTAVVSLLNLTEDGASSEIAVVGNDGMVGVSLFMGGDATPSQAVVQCAGEAYRMRAQVAR